MGSFLVERLLSDGWRVRVVDNLSSGRWENLRGVEGHGGLEVVVRDLKEPDGLGEAFREVDVVFHFAANPNLRVSVEDPRVCFDENLVATFSVLECCRRFKVDFMVFASSSTVYGEPSRIPTPEDYWPLKPISVYGSCKLACEELIGTYSRLYGVKSLVLRYANVVGPRSSRGVLVDFLRKLRREPGWLEILGDGSQRKSYLHVEDAVEATMRAYYYVEEAGLQEEVFNVGSEDWVTVREIADLAVEALGLGGVKYVFRPATLDGRGWLGDVKFMLLDVSKLRDKTGWRPRLNSRGAVARALKELIGEGCQ